MNKDLLHKALGAAAKDLEANHEWFFGQDGNRSDYFGLDPTFLEVFHKHISPLLDMEEVNKRRITQLYARRDALNAELASLEKNSE